MERRVREANAGMSRCHRSEWAVAVAKRQIDVLADMAAQTDRETDRLHAHAVASGRARY